MAPVVLPPRGRTVILTPGAPTQVVVPGHGGATLVTVPERHPVFVTPPGKGAIIASGPPRPLVITQATPFPIVPANSQARIVTAGDLAFPRVPHPMAVTVPGASFVVGDGIIAVPNRGFIVAPGDTPVFVGPPGTQRAKIFSP